MVPIGRPAGSLGSVDVRGNPGEVRPSTAPALMPPLVAVTVRLPATQARVTVVVVTPLEFVVVEVSLTRSALDGEDVIAQVTVSALNGTPFTSSKVARTVIGTLHLRTPPGPATLIVPSTCPA